VLFYALSACVSRLLVASLKFGVVFQSGVCRLTAVCFSALVLLSAPEVSTFPKSHPTTDIVREMQLVR
jgi:hypothetical protein